MNTFNYLVLAGLLAISSAVTSSSSSSSSSSSPLIRVKRQDDYDEDYEAGDYPEQDEAEAALGLPNDSSSIRENIVDEFTCEGRPYGYYGDVANDCQIFHICYPVTYADGEQETFKWSFICPNQTIFDQSTLVCAFPLDALPCEDAPSFYNGPDSINDQFGKVIEDDETF